MRYHRKSNRDGKGSYRVIHRELKRTCEEIPTEEGTLEYTITSPCLSFLLSPHRKLSRYSTGKDSYWIELREVIYLLPPRNEKKSCSFHKRDLAKGTLLEILKQAGISREKLREL